MRHAPLLARATPENIICKLSALCNDPRRFTCRTLSTAYIHLEPDKPIDNEPSCTIITKASRTKSASCLTKTDLHHAWSQDQHKHQKNNNSVAHYTPALLAAMVIRTHSTVASPLSCTCDSQHRLHVHMKLKSWYRQQSCCLMSGASSSCEVQYSIWHTGCTAADPITARSLSSWLHAYPSRTSAMSPSRKHSTAHRSFAPSPQNTMREWYCSSARTCRPLHSAAGQNEHAWALSAGWHGQIVSFSRGTDCGAAAQPPSIMSRASVALANDSSPTLLTRQ